jgi:predicted N-acetyltransferase YhbS
MSDLSLTILAETANDAQAIERLLARTFGPGRFVLSAYRLREHVDHLLDLSFTARIGTLLVGSVRQLPVLVGDTKALLLGPLTVEPPFRSRGVGRALLDRALKDAKTRGHRLVLLVGDEAYYGRVGFKPVPKGRASIFGCVRADRSGLEFRALDARFTASAKCRHRSRGAGRIAGRIRRCRSRP